MRSATRDVHFHGLIRQQRAVVPAAAALAEAGREMGWDRVAFVSDVHQLHLETRDNGEFILQSIGWPRDSLDEWVRRKLGRHCPVARRCSSVQDPFVWDTQATGLRWGDQLLEPEQREALRHYGAIAVGGLTVPVRHGDGRVGYVSWLTRSRAQLRERYEETFSSLYMLSTVFLQHLDGITEPQVASSEGVLTPREIECLQWASRGKTEEEIAIIIGRSRQTVHFHMRNVVTKLEASNRTHAVAIACSRGLLSLQ